MILVNTEKKEWIGPYQNTGWEWRSNGEPKKALAHDFIDPAVPKAFPYGVCDARGEEESLTGKFTIRPSLKC